MHKLAIAALLAASVANAEPQKPTVSIGAVKVVVGTFDTVAATKVVKRAHTKLLACVKRANHGGGVATAKIKLAVDGKVSSVTVTGLASSDTDPVHNCIADALVALKFAAPKGGAVVDLSVRLAVKGGTDASPFGSLIGSDASKTFGGFGHSSGIGNAGGGTGTLGTRHRPVGGGGLPLGEPTTSGGLDKATIRRYIERDARRIQDCYEKALLVTPKLEGTVRTQFTISTTGMVSVSTASGLNSPKVEACVSGVIKRIQFPKPKTGEVVVAYPFTFKLPPPAKAEQKK